MDTKNKLIFTTPAQQDLEKIVLYHAENAGGAYAGKIYQTMRERFEQLREFPLMGPMHPDAVLRADGFRALVLTKTYVAIYKYAGDTVTIYAIVNGRTDYPKLLK